MARVRLGVYLGEDGVKLGPGKVALLRAIRREGSISGAARSMGMAYRHAWTMIDELNRCFSRPAVRVTIGGRSGGGAELTPWGGELIACFEEMEQTAGRALADLLATLDRQLARPGRSRSARAGRMG
ncbi:LysR family transcriptional regulator [Myxococcota bacterium]|nr:LysR family transcriptional regulator [Myxococcota bacterium]